MDLIRPTKQGFLFCSAKPYDIKTFHGAVRKRLDQRSTEI
jgi:hypothetical protein